jgi:outer membrane protein TolC
MGYPEGTLPKEVTFPSDFKNDFGDLPAVEIYLDAALSHRPDLKGYREQLEVARYQLYKTYSAYSPTVNAFANFGFNTNESHTHVSHYHEGGIRYSHEDSRTYYNQPTFTYGVTADWTIFNGFIRYNTMREYQANLAAAEYSVAAQWFTVVGEVRAAYANYVQSVRQTRYYEKIRSLSQQQRDLVREEYNAGNAELTRLNEAQRDLVEAETNLAGSYIAVQNAKAQLDSAVGANTAEYYMQQNEEPKNAAPGLEGLEANGEKTEKADKPADKPAEKADKPAEKKTEKADKPAKKAEKPAEKPAAKPAKSTSKQTAPEIPASPTAAPKAKSGK